MSSFRNRQRLKFRDVYGVVHEPRLANLSDSPHTWCEAVLGPQYKSNELQKTRGVTTCLQCVVILEDRTALPVTRVPAVSRQSTRPAKPRRRPSVS